MDKAAVTIDIAAIVPYMAVAVKGIQWSPGSQEPPQAIRMQQAVSNKMCIGHSERDDLFNEVLNLLGFYLKRPLMK